MLPFFSNRSLKRTSETLKSLSIVSKIYVHLCSFGDKVFTSQLVRFPHAADDTDPNDGSISDSTRTTTGQFTVCDDEEV